MSHSSKRAVLTALVANVSIAIAKTFGAAITKSGSLFAEALHSWADCINQIFLLIGMSQSQRKPDDDHPMGYGKVGYFYSMCVAFMLFFFAGVASIHHGIEVWSSNEPIKHVEWSVAILLFSVVLEGYALYSALKSARLEIPGATIWEWFKETRNSELLIVVAEDSGALLGLTIALIALTATAITGNPVYDAAGTIGVGVLLIAVSLNVMIEVKSMITGESIGDEKEQAIIDYLESQPEVEKVINIITQHYGKDVMVALKVQMKRTGSDLELVNCIDSVEDRMQKKFNIKWSFFEPDIERA